MPLLQVGRNRIANLMWGNSTCHWGTSCATIWVSSSTGAHDAASTWPAATTGPSTMESGYPAAGASTNIMEHRGVFGTCCANFQWEAWWIHSATASGSGATLNWAPTQALGTKTSAQSWQITTCLTITTAWLFTVGLAQMFTQAFGTFA